MAQTKLVTNPDEGPIENEIPDPPPEENTFAPTTGPTRLAMGVLDYDPNAKTDEIPDPPPEENT